MMVAVAVFAHGLGLLSHHRNMALRAQYLDRAEVFESHREEYREKAAEARRRARSLVREGSEAPETLRRARELCEKASASESQWAELMDRIARYDDQMALIYQHAAELPWEPLPSGAFPRKP
jgi:hypothetical protein